MLFVKRYGNLERRAKNGPRTLFFLKNFLKFAESKSIPFELKTEARPDTAAAACACLQRYTSAKNNPKAGAKVRKFVGPERSVMKLNSISRAERNALVKR